VVAAVEVAAGEVAVAVVEVAVEVAVVAVDTSPRPLGNWTLTRFQDGLEATVIPFATADGDQLHRIHSNFMKASGLA
jgi:hypothetical protein